MTSASAAIVDSVTWPDMRSPYMLSSRQKSSATAACAALGRKYRFRDKCSPKNLLSSDTSLMAIFAEVTENERIIDRHLHGIHPLLDYDASES